MKAKLVSCILLLLGSAAQASDHYVSGYVRQNGTYVQPHYQTDSNNTRLDNYSTQGNVNPYTGSVGTTNPYDSGGSSENFGRRSYGNGSGY